MSLTLGTKCDPDKAKCDPDKAKWDPDKAKWDPDKVEAYPDKFKWDPDKSDPDKAKLVIKTSRIQTSQIQIKPRWDPDKAKSYPQVVSRQSQVGSRPWIHVGCWIHLASKRARRFEDWYVQVMTNNPMKLKFTVAPHCVHQLLVGCILQSFHSKYSIFIIPVSGRENAFTTVVP